MNKSIFGLSENVASLLAYAFGFVSGFVVLIMERENKTVRFHALQSTLWFLLTFILFGVINFLFGWIPSWVPLIGWVPQLVSLVITISWLFLMITALAGKIFKIPLVGDVAQAFVEK